MRFQKCPDSFGHDLNEGCFWHGERMAHWEVIFWWSLKHIIAVSSVCPNVQCPMIICFYLAVFSFSSLLC